MSNFLAELGAGGIVAYVGYRAVTAIARAAAKSKSVAPYLSGSTEGDTNKVSISVPDMFSWTTTIHDGKASVGGNIRLGRGSRLSRPASWMQ